MSDLTLTTARADRDALAARTEVLDKVGVLRTLMVAGSATANQRKGRAA
jgi:hypothetical protein